MLPWLQLLSGALEDSYLLTSSTQAQVSHLDALKDLSGALLYVEGPHRLWMKAVLQHYYSLRLLLRKEGEAEGREEGWLCKSYG